MATVIVAVIAEIILYIMEKEAAVYMVLLNLTDDPLELQDLTITHGKQTVQFVGWEVTLTGAFGGPNRCLASADFPGSVEAFSDQTNENGTLDSRSQAGRGLVRARMHSGKGSRGYMSVIFDTV